MGVDLAAMRTMNSEMRQLRKGLSELKEQMGEVKELVKGQGGELRRHITLEVDNVMAGFDDQDRIRRNTLKDKRSDRLEIIGKYVHGLGYQDPAYFPEIVNMFWSLRLPKNGKYLTA